MDKTSFRIFLVIIVVSLIIFSGLFAFAMYENKINEDKIEVEYVTNANIFYTVESCVNKYVSLIVAQDSIALYNVTDEQYREEHGSFKNIEELKEVKGIGDAKYEEIKDLVDIK